MVRTCNFRWNGRCNQSKRQAIFHPKEEICRCTRISKAGFHFTRWTARVLSARSRDAETLAREQSRREEKNHIDPREPYTPRRRRLRINKDFPSRAFRVERENISNIQRPSVSCHPSSHRCLFALLLSRSARNIFYRLPPRHSPRTRSVNFPSLLPYNLSQPSPSPSPSSSLFFRPRDTSHAYEYIGAKGLCSRVAIECSDARGWKIRDWPDSTTRSIKLALEKLRDRKNCWNRRV